MSQPIRVALIGGGTWARLMHLPALCSLPGVEVVGVACRTEHSAREIAHSFSIPRWTKDFRELVRDDSVDMVDVVTPSFMREEVCVEAAAHGKHIVCIKPLATSLAEALRIEQAVRDAGVRLFYAENVVFIPAMQELRRLLRGGRIGSVFRLRSALGLLLPDQAPAWHFASGPGVERGVDLFSEVSSHSIALCRALLGDKIVSVYAEAGNYVLGNKIPGPDTAVLTLRFRGGAIAQCEDSWSLRGGPETRVEVYGTHGCLEADVVQGTPLRMKQGRGTGGDGPADDPPLSPGRWSPMPVGQGVVQDGHRDMLACFIDALARGTPAVTEIGDGVAVAAAVDAARTSWRTGTRVMIEQPDKVG